MLSRKRRQEIVELMEVVAAGVKCFVALQEAAMLKECVAAFSAVHAAFQKELSPMRFAYYQESVETLLAVLQHLLMDKDQRTAELCCDLLDALIAEIYKEPVKKEILFLPYKAAMWDCMESIWRAAAADAERCNAYVAVIPYAEFTPEHTVKAWYCEKELFPKDVPILDYQALDLEKLHPDVIFIHNPYDGGNAVTSVDSRYYSKALKPYTDHLVYVPYFVSGDDEEMFTGFFNAVGLATVDHVVVESEFVKAQYERHYHWGTPPPGKYVTLGSPKYDKVQRGGTKATYPLPKAWLTLLRGRKSVLYNTSLHASLVEYDVFCQKTRQVLEFFGQREDVVLWWRPHPLMEAALDAMYPEVAEEYHRLTAGYQAEGWGIYDQTPEMTRAVLWADAYYGDVSGVLWSFQRTGKPILLEDIALAKEPDHLSRCKTRGESDFCRTPEEEEAKKNPLHRESEGWSLRDFLRLLGSWEAIPMDGGGEAGRRIYAWAMALGAR